MEPQRRRAGLLLLLGAGPVRIHRRVAHEVPRRRGRSLGVRESRALSDLELHLRGLRWAGIRCAGSSLDIAGDSTRYDRVACRELTSAGHHEAFAKLHATRAEG